MLLHKAEHSAEARRYNRFSADIVRWVAAIVPDTDLLTAPGGPRAELQAEVKRVLCENNRQWVQQQSKKIPVKSMAH